VPPTKIPTNEFLGSFQAIVDTYGIPTYKEVNPAIFAIVSFPFLFGVMFGDIAHGAVLFLFGCILVWKADKLKDSALGPIVQARYLILLMGFFATYCGLLYNDFTSIPVENFANSCYNDNSARKIHDCNYLFGLDPRWYRAKDEITFVNSLKMKTSVILGVAQMLLGISMKAFNAIQFNSKTDFLFEFIPQIIMMSVLFGYMNLLIIIKWLTDYEMHENDAPSIITTLINMPLKGGLIQGSPFIGEGTFN